jgi:hypothetical protein
VENAGDESEAENILEKSRFDNHLSDPLWNEGPVNIPLTAGNMLDDSLCALEGKKSRRQCCNNKEELFRESEHDFSRFSLQKWIRIFSGTT